MRKNALIYFIALSAAAVVKICGSAADSDSLTWILTPVSWWVTLLSGISFEYTSHVGYVSHAHRFIIAPSCAGVRFLLLTFLMLIFSFTHLLRAQKQKTLWLVCSMVFSYLATIFVNGIRITLAIYLPELLAEKALMPQGLDAKSLHTMIGTAVYFSSLFVLYFLADKICVRVFGEQHEKAERKSKAKSPVLWYIAVVLVLPFLSRLYQGEWAGFGKYALLVTSVCAVVGLFFMLITGVRDYVRKGRFE